ncbi:pilus assembly protein TadG-related protein [Tardiphaga sp.]|uniref:TadE/TadG family type IV pilus assembly protein n=1 Tax=Tardiphaga sp. TaxID=1926292 RepID=UPI001999D703|nr:pilus assembly protein TadG-related protein [Tardiphaga sp.]MBC7581002.1 pilus assembly protein [Tardiphaga sp.]
MTWSRVLQRVAVVALPFNNNKSGSIAVIFAIACVPLIISIGCAVDYAQAMRMRGKLQAAADAASVGAVASKSPGYIAATGMSADGVVAVARTDALAIFNGNISGLTGYNNLLTTTTVTKVGLQLTSTVQFSASVTTTFMKLVGYPTLTVNSTSVSEATLPGYLDFYLMLDVSGSMGLPSTNSEQTRLAAINPDNYSQYPNGCTFACHFTNAGACSNSTQKYNTNNYCMGYSLSRTAGNSGNTAVSNCASPGTGACIQLRADAVGYAVSQLLVTANASAKIANQYRVGLYPFIQNLYTYFALTSSINGSPSNAGTINYAAANLASLLDTGVNSNLGSGGTHFENVLPAMNTLISSVGTGTAWNNTLPYVFLVTDGAQNNQTQWGGGWSGNNNATVMNSTLCASLKNRGIVVAILYIPYQTIQNPTSFANNEDYAVNAIIPNIPATLQACASPNFFFTANTPADITTALNAMFNQALVTAHITN